MHQTNFISQSMQLCLVHHYFLEALSAKHNIDINFDEVPEEVSHFGYCFPHRYRIAEMHSLFLLHGAGIYLPCLHIGLLL